MAHGTWLGAQLHMCYSFYCTCLVLIIAYSGNCFRFSLFLKCLFQSETIFLNNWSQNKISVTVRSQVPCTAYICITTIIMYHLPRGRDMPLYVCSLIIGVVTVTMATAVVTVLVNPMDVFFRKGDSVMVYM